MSVESLKNTQDFHGVMDGDSAPHRIDTEKAGDYKLLINARNGINNQGNYLVEDVEGNLLIPNQYLSAFPGQYKTVGKFKDVAGLSIIYLVWNSFGHNAIFRYWRNRPQSQNGVIELVWQVRNPSIYDEYNRNPLDFHPDYLCEGINLVDNLLLWTNYYGEPKQMDIVRANEVGKRRKFNFFINQKELATNITYTLTLTDPLGVVTTLAISSFKNVLQDRIDELINQINSNPASGYMAINKTNFIEIEISQTGRYQLSVSDTGVSQSRILAGNFYQDDVPGNFFNRIQAPPFCRPDAYYIPAGFPTGGSPIRGFLVNGFFDFGTPFGTDPFAATIMLGIPTEVNDVNGNIVTGISNTEYYDFDDPAFTGVSYNDVKAWLQTNNGSLTFTASWDLTVTLRNVLYEQGGNITPYAPAFQMSLLKITPSGTITIEHTFISIYPGLLPSPTTYPYPGFVSQQVNVSGSSSDKYFIAMFGRGTNGQIQNGQVDLGNSGLGTATEAIIKQTNMFRSKYVWENFQHSVYGQATSLVLRTEGYNAQFQIQIDYNDKFITNDDYCSRLRKIVYSFTKDGGLTWYDFDTLEPYQFVCQDTQSVIFDNKKTAFPVAPTAAGLQFHTVPLKARSQEYIDNRIFSGGVVEGYDVINVDIEIGYRVEDLKLNTYYSDGLLPISKEGFKPGYRGFIGLVYYDDFDRKCAVCIGKNSEVNVPYYPDPLLPSNLFTEVNSVWSLTVNIFSEPPDWATKYRLVRTKDFSQSDYLMWMVDSFDIVDENGNTGGALVYYRIKFDNIPYYVDKAKRGAVISYTYQVGDRIKILTNQAGAFLSQIFDFEIKSANANEIYVDYDPLVGLEQGAIVELYSKAGVTTLEDSLFYEMGECQKIEVGIFNGIKKKYHTGNNQEVPNYNQQYNFGGVSNPARLITYHGGVYNRIRKLFYDTTDPVPSNIVGADYWINSNFADEFEQSKEDGLTRYNQVLRIGQVHLNPGMRFTNPYLSGTEVNGLNENEPANGAVYDTVYGLLEKMQVINNDILKLVFSNSYQMSLYISQGIIRQSQGPGNLISVTGEVASNSHMIQRTLGTTNPESVVINDEGDAFGYDMNKGTVWRSSGNGLIPVSSYKQTKNFREWSNARKLLNVKKSQCPSIYDIFHDEYILTLGRLEPAPLVLPTVVLDIQNLFASDTIGPGGPTGLQFTTEILVLSPSQTILPTTPCPAGSDLHTQIKNAFQFWGWTVVTNPQNGKLELTAPDLTFNDKEVYIKVTTNEPERLGEEKVRNPTFIYPNAPVDWQFTMPNWMLNLFGPTDQSARHTPLAGNGALIQRNLGLEVGVTYRVTMSNANLGSGTIQVILGEAPYAVLGAVTAFTVTDFSQDLPYLDPFNDVVSIFPSLDLYNSLTKLSIRSVSPNEPYIFRYKMINGSPAQQGTAFEPVTMSFYKNKQGWPQRYEFYPEMYGDLNDNIFSFVNGQLWMHSILAVPKNFYGVQHERRLNFVVNKAFPSRKVFKAIAINGIGVNTSPTLKIPPFEGVPTGMETELTLAHFKTREGIQYAAIPRDKLTPGQPTPVAAWVNGREMRGEVLEVELVNNLPQTSIIYSAEILYFYSEIT